MQPEAKGPGEDRQLYKVMLVDDEVEVRQAIARKLDWEGLGFVVAGEAANGEEALELAEALQPDVVMTDIRMPFMDGLTLCRRLKAALPGVKVAIFSGFDEFEYAKEAITLEVEEYILKPIDAAELAEVFSRMRQALDDEIAERRDIQRLRHYYAESLPMMRQQFLIGLVEGRIAPADIEPMMRRYELDLLAPGYCVALVRTDAADPGASEDSRLLAFSLQQLIAESLPAGLRWMSVPPLDDILVLFLLEEDQSPRWVAQLLDHLYPKAKKLLGIRVSVGVSGPCASLAELRPSLLEARSALEYQVLAGDAHSVYIGDIEPGGGEDDCGDGRCVDDIVREIKVGTAESLREAVDALLHNMKSQALGVQRYQLILLELSTALLRLMRAYGLESGNGELVGRLIDCMGRHFSGLAELGQWVWDTCEELRQNIRLRRKDTTRSLVEQARAYLSDHYADPDLGVDTLAGELNVSPAYFSTLFKRETGEGFVAYLTRLRMEKALEYLNTTDDKTYIISDKVGYADPNYFSYVFKKQYGVAPSKYRHREGTEREGKFEAGPAPS